VLIYASAAILALGVALLFVGMRGRRVDDDPHCRKCGFNLRGRPEDSTRCAECGADITRKRATRIGGRQRRGKLLAFGVLVTLASAGMLGWIGYEGGKTYEWVRLKSVAWLLRDLDATDRTIAGAAMLELQRRIADKSVPQAKVDRIVDHALARQGDRGVAWDSRFGDLIERAGMAGRLDDARTDRYVAQGIEVKLLAKSKLRRGQPYRMQVSVKPDRFSSFGRPRGTWTVAPLKIGDQWLDAGFGGDRRRNLDLFPSVTSTDNDAFPASMPEGTYALTTTVTTVTTTVPRLRTQPTILKFPLSMPIEICPAGATVDTFSTDPQFRDAMRIAVSQARVFQRADGGRLDVRFKTDAPLPLPIAAEIFIVQNGVEQSVGRTLIDTNPASPWHGGLYIRDKLPERGKVDVHLRPSQQAADREVALATYWGEPIIFRDVEIDAPYDAPLNKDESLRPAVEAALSAPVIHRDGSKFPVRYRITYKKVPVKLDYEVLVVSGGKERSIGNWRTHEQLRFSGSASGSALEFDPDHRASTIDVIFRPNRNWEVSSYDATPPWGGEIVYRNVRIDDGPIDPFPRLKLPATLPAAATTLPAEILPETWKPLSPNPFKRSY
jgi:hypothetical protein